MKVCILANGSSRNHGCEAITRSTLKILDLPDDFYIATTDLKDEELYCNDIFSHYKEYSYEPHPSFIEKVIASLVYHTTKKVLHFGYDYSAFEKEIINSDIVLYAGGDNYCYNNYGWLIKMHDIAVKHNKKCVLWGCSVEERALQDNTVLNDIKRYDLVIARESLTFELLKKYGFEDSKIRLIPDPAFQLNCDKSEQLDETKDYVGINISPLVIKQETEKGIVVKNTRNCIDYILENTDMSILLIPHVTWNNNDDRTSLQIVKDYYKDNQRVIMVSDNKAELLKGYIARCRFFIGARTHATIAAYSSSVPTVVIGYSIKAKGIAKDLFGTFEKYVIPVQSIKNDDELKNEFIWLYDNEKKIRDIFKSSMHDYVNKAKSAKDEIERMVEANN